MPVFRPGGPNWLGLFGLGVPVTGGLKFCTVVTGGRLPITGGTFGSGVGDSGGGGTGWNRTGGGGVLGPGGGTRTGDPGGVEPTGGGFPPTGGVSIGGTAGCFVGCGPTGLGGGGAGANAGMLAEVCDTVWSYCCTTRAAC